MVSGVFSSERQNIEVFLQFAKKPTDIVCELTSFMPTNAIDKKIADSITGMGSFDLIITYFNPALRFIKGSSTFTPDDANQTKLLTACSLVIWRDNYTRQLRIMKDVLNLGPDLTIQWDAFIKARYH